MDDAAAVNLETKKFNSKKMQQKYHIRQWHSIYIRTVSVVDPAACLVKLVKTLVNYGLFGKSNISSQTSQERIECTEAHGVFFRMAQA
jgi:hypothetical protein